MSSIKTAAGMMRRDRLLVLLVTAPLFLTALELTVSRYLTRVVDSQRAERARFVTEIVTRNAASPYRYRILIPSATSWLARQHCRTSTEPTQACFDQADKEITFGAFLLTGLSLLLALWMFLPFPYAFLGTFIGFHIAAQTFQDHFYQPWSYLEPAFLAGAMAAMVRRKPYLFAAIAIAAVLNRETGVLLPLLLTPELLLNRNEGRRRWLPALIGPVAAFLLLRLWLGGAPHVHSIAWILHRNFESTGQAAERWLSLFGAYWIPLGFGIVAAVRRRSRLLPFLVAYLASVLVFGLWVETRLMVGILPILVLLILEPVREAIRAGSRMST